MVLLSWRIIGQRIGNDDVLRFTGRRVLGTVTFTHCLPVTIDTMGSMAADLSQRARLEFLRQ